MDARARFERSLTGGWPGAAVPDRLAECSMASARRLHVEEGVPPAGPDGEWKRPSDESRAAFDAADRFVAAVASGRRPGAGLVLTGPVGTGKSGLLAAVTHAVRALGVPVLWTTYADLVASVQAEYGTDRDGSRLLNAQRCGLLVLDELGDPFRERGEAQETEDRRRIVYAVVAARAAAFRPTLASANYDSMGALAEQFDPRVADRLRESCERHTLPGVSLRRAPRI